MALSLVGVATAAAGPKRTTPANDTPAKRQKLFRQARHKLVESNALLQGVVDGSSPRPARDALRSAQLRVDALFAAQDARGDHETPSDWRDHFARREAELVDSPALDALVRHEILSSPGQGRTRQRSSREPKGKVMFPSVGQTVYSAQLNLHRPERPAFDATPGGTNRGSMVRQRTLRDVSGLLGTRFRATMAQLTDKQVWLDVGTGVGSAPAGYVSSTPGGARVIGVDLRIDSSAERAARDSGGRLRFRQGDIRSMRFGRKVDLITDVYGAMAYSDRPDQVLRKYGELLAPGGELMIMLGASEIDTVLDRDGGGGERLIDFIGRAKGFELERVAELNVGTVAILRRTSDRVSVPSLQMLKASDRGPPHRTFRVTRGAGPSTTSAGRDAYERALYRPKDNNW